MNAAQNYPVLTGYADGISADLHSVKEVAEFICKHGVNGDVYITKEDGSLFLNTFGIYINQIADMEYRRELLPVLIPMQIWIDGTDDMEKGPDLRG